MASPTHAAVTGSHVEAFCCTGSSPGHEQVPVAFPLELGGAVSGAVHFETFGPDVPRPVLVLGGISADRHLAPTPADPRPGWWPGVVGPGAALDPNRHGLLGIDYVTATATTGARVTTRDQARAIVAVLDSLDVESVTLVGSSYGGMVGLALAELFPERVHELVVLCAAHRPHPMATALRSIQRRVARSGSAPGSLSLARALAMTTYRSAREFDERFDWRAEKDAATRFPVEAYLEARGEDFAARFTAADFTALSESIDLHGVDPTRVTARTTLVSVDTDSVVPPWLVDELAQAAPGVRLHVTLESAYGHDAFLKEARLVTDVLRSALQRGGER